MSCLQRLLRSAAATELVQALLLGAGIFFVGCAAVLGGMMIALMVRSL